MSKFEKKVDELENDIIGWFINLEKEERDDCESSHKVFKVEKSDVPTGFEYEVAWIFEDGFLDHNCNEWAFWGFDIRNLAELADNIAKRLYG